MVNEKHGNLINFKKRTHFILRCTSSIIATKNTELYAFYQLDILVPP